MSRIHEPPEHVLDRTPPTPVRRRRTTLLYVCVSLFVLLFLIGLGVAIALWHTYETYTATSPVTLPSVELSAAARQDLQARLDACSEHLERGEPCEIEFSAAEINTVVEQKTPLKNRVLFIISNGSLQANVSIPFAELGLAEWSGRWLNGEGTLSIAKQEGVLHVNLLSVVVNGRPLPAQLQTAIAQHNLADDAAFDAESAGYIKRIDRVMVQDGKVRVQFKAR